jgi:molybdate transport system substrate-binding protein
MKFLILILIAAQGLVSQSAFAQTKILIGAASDLRFVMPEMVKNFNKAHPEIVVQVSYGSSGTLATQIEQSAPFDLFFSADSSYPKHLIEKGLVAGDKDFQYAQGTLVVWYSKKSRLHLSRTDLGKGLKLLLDPRIKKIAIANPVTAPYGRAAASALQKEEIYDQIKAKLVFGENIAQTAEFAETGGADIGILALSLAEAPEFQRKGDYFEVSKTDYPPLIQTLVLLKSSKNPEQAELFKNFILAPGMKTVFAKFGFEN